MFHLKTDKASPAGNHGTLFCQVVVTQNGEPIVHNIGTGTLRIDVPLPPKAAASAVAAAKPAAAPPPARACRQTPGTARKTAARKQARAKALASERGSHE